MKNWSRRSFLSVTAGSAATRWWRVKAAPETGMRFGLVTYQWGRDWDLGTILENCRMADFAGVELRTEHAHGVEPTLSASERSDVKRRFEDSGVICVGYGSNQEFHSPDPAEVRRNIEGTFELIKLCHDIGATGVKVKPNNLPDGVAPEKTIAQIASALNEVGRYAADYGLVIRVEVHGRRTAEIPVMRAIFDQVTENNVGTCWNCNEQDLLPPGLEQNFKSLRDRFGDTVHVHPLNDPKYPNAGFIKLLVETGYAGWVLLEASDDPADRVAAMREQSALFKKLVVDGMSG